MSTATQLRVSDIEEHPASGKMVKVFAIVGLFLSIVLTFLDFFTSVMGVRQIMGGGNGGWVVSMMPWVFGGLAVTFNGLSAHVFRMYAERGFGTFATTLTFCMWAFFVVYDTASSFLGILHSYTGKEINSLEILEQAWFEMGVLPGVLAIFMSVLLSCGPYLCSMFSDLAVKEGAFGGQ